MPFAARQLAYHPAGDTQEALFAQDEPALRDAGVRTILTSELFANVTYVALNLGEGYGVLSAIDPAASRPPTVRDVALFQTLPNDLGHVAGVISATPQTPLSHINLKAKQNDTPNAYVRGARHRPADRAAARPGRALRRHARTTSSSRPRRPSRSRRGSRRSARRSRRRRRAT